MNPSTNTAGQRAAGTRTRCGALARRRMGAIAARLESDVDRMLAETAEMLARLSRWRGKAFEGGSAGLGVVRGPSGAGA